MATHEFHLPGPHKRPNIPPPIRRPRVPLSVHLQMLALVARTLPGALKAFAKEVLQSYRRGDRWHD